MIPLAIIALIITGIIIKKRRASKDEVARYYAQRRQEKQKIEGLSGTYKSQIPKPEVYKMDTKTKVILIVCSACSLLVGFIATRSYFNYIIQTEEYIIVTESMRLEKVFIIPLAFILGFIIPLIAIGLAYLNLRALKFSN